MAHAARTPVPVETFEDSLVFCLGRTMNHAHQCFCNPSWYSDGEWFTLFNLLAAAE